ADVARRPWGALGRLQVARPPAIPAIPADPAVQRRALGPWHLFGCSWGAGREDPGAHTVSPPQGATASRATRNTPRLGTTYKGKCALCRTFCHEWHRLLPPGAGCRDLHNRRIPVRR